MLELLRRFFMKPNRRDLLAGIGIVGSGLILSACSPKNSVATTPLEKPMDDEVTAVEDLMREHGVLRRALFVYSEAAVRLRRNPANVAPDAIHKTAQLFRSFGEDYHERKLEEAYIFPVVKKAGGPAAKYPDILIAQHNRGREITDYILAVTQGAKLDTDKARPLTQAMRSLVRMYRPHAAREDTIVFPEWKLCLTAEQLDEMNEKFEDIEHKMFGEDGFEKAVRQIGNIEKEFGLADLAQFTAPPPPTIQ
jgi:hemerythrin-like domain-containing protein